jgi:hypothetical protein
MSVESSWSSLCNKGVIGEVRCGFFRIYASTPYSTVFLLHAPAPIKISFGVVRSCGLDWTHLDQIGPVQMSI